MTKQEFEAELLKLDFPFLRRDDELNGVKLRKIVDHYGSVFPLDGTREPMILSLFYWAAGERLYNASLTQYDWHGRVVSGIDVFSYTGVLEWLRACLE